MLKHTQDPASDSQNEEREGGTEGGWGGNYFQQQHNKVSSKHSSLVVPVCGKLRQDYYQFMGSLGYIAKQFSRYQNKHLRSFCFPFQQSGLKSMSNSNAKHGA